MLNYLLIFILSLLSSYLGTKLALKFLLKYKMLDIPSDRSNHKIPIPRGGGICIVIAILMVINFTKYHQLIIPVLLLGIVSFIDDMKGAGVLARFGVQIIAVAIGIHMLPEARVFQGLLSENMDKFVAGFLLLGFINAFNFMDGIDGITTSETVHICASLLLLAILPSEFQSLLIVIIAATIGFGVWNWHPAKIFMGDVGSVPLGFILGWMLLYIATRGYFIEAMIIPAYYLADTGITLLKRLVQGKKIWQAHSEHFYQQAVRAGRSHSRVVKMVIANNLVLMILTYFSLDYPGMALSLAIISTLGLLVLFKRKIKTVF